MTRIDNNNCNPYFNNEKTDFSVPQKMGIDQLLDQIKAKKEDCLDLDLKQLKRQDSNNLNNNNLEKLWTYGCARTKGGVHCPGPRDPKPDPTPAPQPKPKPNKPS
jgi:hypothetical protein